MSMRRRLAVILSALFAVVVVTYAVLTWWLAGRNVTGAANALSCANMALAGYDHLIPFDEVLDAHRQVSELMARELRCTGLGGLVKEIQTEHSIEYKDIPNFPVSTVKGHHGRLIFGELSGAMVVALQGRFHFYEGYSMQQVTLPILDVNDFNNRIIRGYEDGNAETDRQSCNVTQHDPTDRASDPGP